MCLSIRKLFCILYLTPKVVLAEALAKQGTHLTSVESPMSFSYVFQILISFVIVIGFILLMAWLMRRTGRFGQGNSQIIKIISTMPLGMREKIMVIEIGEVNIVVGVAPGQIRTLHVLESGIEIRDRENIKAYTSAKGFKSLVEKFTKQ